MGDIHFNRPGLDVTVTKGDPAVVTAVGEVDISTVDALQQGLDTAAGEPVQHDVDADLEQIDFIDVGGARTLIRADDRITCKGHRFSVRSASRAVRRLLALLNVGHLIRPPR